MIVTPITSLPKEKSPLSFWRSLLGLLRGKIPALILHKSVDGRQILTARLIARVVNEDPLRVASRRKTTQERARLNWSQQRKVGSFGNPPSDTRWAED